MFKIIPKTNNLYEMSVEGQIRRTDGVECTLTILNNEAGITLVMCGKERTVNIEWLRLITHFEMNLPYKYFFVVYFKDIFKWHNGNSVSKTMCFYGQRPEYKPGYRYVPEYTRYAVSKEGEVIDTYCGKNIPLIYHKNKYITVYIYDSDKCRYKNILLHRLVALAWVKNPDHMKYYLVNHIDGNKHNPHYTNLEWTNHKGNVEHAYSTDLRNDNKPILVRNVKTNEIKEYYSCGECARILNLDEETVRQRTINKNNTPMFPGFLQFKYKDDPNPWINVDISVDQNYIKGFSRKIKVKDINTGEIFHFDNITLCEKFTKYKMGKVFNGLPSDVKKGFLYKWEDDETDWLSLTKEQMEYYNKYSFYNGNRDVFVTNLDTNEKKYFYSIKQAAEYYKVKEYNIIARCANNTVIDNKYVFAYDNKDYSYICRYPKGNKLVLSRDINSKNILEFSSVRKAAEYFNIPPCTVTRRAKSKQIVREDNQQFKFKDDLSEWINYSDKEIAIMKNNGINPIIAKNAITGIETEYSSMLEAANANNTNDCSIKRNITQNKIKPHQGFYYRFKY